MKTLAIISQKGGSGKTTLAVHLAVCATKEGLTVALIDIDKQASSFKWYETREKTNELVVIKAKAPKLPDLLDQAKNGGIDLCIIDTAPHTEEPITTVAKIADFIVVPTKPYVLELRAVPDTVDVLAFIKADHKYAVVIMESPIGHQGDKARAALEGQGYPVLYPYIGDRVAFKHALADGRAVHEYEPNGKAASEMKALYDVIRGKLEKEHGNMGSHKPIQEKRIA